MFLFFLLFSAAPLTLTAAVLSMKTKVKRKTFGERVVILAEKENG